MSRVHNWKLSRGVLFSGLLLTDVRLPLEPLLPVSLGPEAPLSLGLEALLPHDTTAQAVSLAVLTSLGSLLVPAILADISNDDRGIKGKGRLRLSLLLLILDRPGVGV